MPASGNMPPVNNTRDNPISRRALLRAYSALWTVASGDHERGVLKSLFQRLGIAQPDLDKCAKEVAVASPVDAMDSVEALDLLDSSLKMLRDAKPADPAFLDRLREQRLRHRRALRTVIGSESL